ncbi:MAG: TolC family protein [Chitinophagaceae bacterium]|nr:TolC family protein [Chitinophagaceae bacterium]
MKKIIILAMFLIAQQSITAQVKTNGELKELINRSFSYFPKIKEADNAILTATERVALTKLNNSVTVNATGSYTFIDPVPSVVFPVGGAAQKISFQPQNNVNTSVTGNYTLVDFGRLKAAVERAKDDIQFAEHNASAARIALAAQVATIYYNIVFLQKAIIIQDSVLAFLAENKKIVAAKIKDGDGLKIDLLNIQATIDNEENKRIDLTNSLAKQISLLSYTTGATNTTGKYFDFNLGHYTVDGAVSNSETNNADFQLAKDKIKQANSDMAITRLQDKPFLNINAGAGFRNGIQPDINQFKFNYLAGVGLTVPIYTGGKVKQQLKWQQQIVKQQEIAYSSLQNNYRKDVSLAINDIQSTKERIKNTASQITQAKYARELAATRFKNDVGTNLELINASTNVQRAELSKLQYEYQLCISKIELARLTGEQYW